MSSGALPLPSGFAAGIGVETCSSTPSWGSEGHEQLILAHPFAVEAAAPRRASQPTRGSTVAQRAAKGACT